jgi:hypothetical protein
MRRGQDNAPRFRSGSASESGVQRLGARIVFVALESVAIESPERIGLANGGWGDAPLGRANAPRIAFVWETHHAGIREYRA